jgi:hypothetical protein
MKNGHPESLARNALETLADVFLVIPGHRAAMNPEPMHTDLEKRVPTPHPPSAKPVFMGSGFGPAGRPGMTRAISGQALRSAQRGRLEGRRIVMQQ